MSKKILVCPTTKTRTNSDSWEAHLERSLRTQFGTAAPVHFPRCSRNEVLEKAEEIVGMSGLSNLQFALLSLLAGNFPLIKKESGQRVRFQAILDREIQAIAKLR
jgi:hypothetical protein